MATQQLIIFNTFYATDLMPQTAATSPPSGWTNLPLWVLLLRNNGPGLGQEWFVGNTPSQKKDPANLTALWSNVYDAVEISSTGYSRQSITPNQILVEGASFDRGQWKIAENSVEFGNPVGDLTQQNIEGVLIYTGVQAGGASDDTNIPLMMQEYSTSKETADGPVTANFPTQVLWQMAQA